MMKRKITGIAAALITATAATITASAEYYIGTEQDGNAVKVEIVADGATLPAIEFTVEMPEDVEIDDIDTISGAFFNEDSGIYAWAGAEAPEDGAVMFSATFIVEDGYEGEFSVTPAEGYEDDMPITLTAEIVGEDGETDDDTEDEETVEDMDDTSDDEEASSEDTDLPSTDEKADDTDSSTTDGDVADSNDEDGDENPDTGITVVGIAAVAAVSGAAAMLVARKRK